MTVTWQCTPFAELKPEDLHAALALRQRVFVVEQQCEYLDADDLDQHCLHLLGWDGGGESRRLVACARLVPPGARYREASFGRIATHTEVRGRGIGHALMAKALEEMLATGWADVRIAAQLYLEGFYERYGFRRVGDPYTEDDIWHVDMLFAKVT